MKSLSKIKEIESVNLFSDGIVYDGKTNDSIKEFYMLPFERLTVSFNEKKDARFYIGDVETNISSDVLFYKKEEFLYFFIMFEKGKNLRKGTLYKYLFEKE